MYWFFQCLVGLIFFTFVLLIIVMYLLGSMFLGVLKAFRALGETILGSDRSDKEDIFSDDKYKINDK